jgi:hypothetical protein
MTHEPTIPVICKACGMRFTGTEYDTEVTFNMHECCDLSQLSDEELRRLAYEEPDHAR